MIRAALVVVLFTVVSISYGQKLNRGDFYTAMASNKLDLISAQEAIVKTSVIPEKDAFHGALLMKKAGLVGKTSEKLSLFKSGHKLLEKAIKNDDNNAELRFLRLMIQEHAPKILNYNDDMTKDSELIKEQFDQMDPETQKAIIEYSKQAKNLKQSDFSQARS